MKKPFIVISNDDGIKAKGLKELYYALRDIGDVFIISPDRSRSGQSHAISLCKPLLVNKVKFADTFAYKVKGTPVDCAKLALLYFCKGKKIDLLVSGINHGANTGTNIIYSGTVGIATEAAFLGIPAVATSIHTFDKDAEFAGAKGYIRRIVKAILSGRLKVKKHTVLNVNIPYRMKIKGMKVLPKGHYEYDEKYLHKKAAKKGQIFYLDLIETGMKAHRRNLRADVHEIEKGYVTLTPLHFDLTDYDEIKIIKKAIKKV
jgi:5'-nucleotidase